MSLEDQSSNESIEASILAAMDGDEPAQADDGLERTIAEVMDEPQADENVQGDKSEKGDEPPAAEKVSEAAKTLSASRKAGRKRQVVEGPALDAPNAEQKPAPIDPPAEWKLDKKEWFNKQPREAQEELARTWGEIRSHTTKIWQDLQQKNAEYGQYKQIVDHYLPQWNLKGIDGPRAVAELCASQHFLTTEPVRGIAELCRKTGVTPLQVHEYLNDPAAAARTPQNGAGSAQTGLTPAQVNELIEKRWQERTVQDEVGRAVNELEQLRAEREQTGQYRYPELFDPTQIARVQSLVTDLGKTNPALSLVEKTKMAVNAIRVLDGRAVSGSPSPNGTRLTPQEIEKARAASSVSVRGRGTNTPILTEAKPGERIEDSILAAMAATDNRF